MATDTNLIKMFSCFQEMTDEQVSKIAQISHSICYPSGYVLFKEGYQGEKIYLLIQGEVEVFHKTDQANLTKVDNISSEEIVGCSAIVPPFVYTATVCTLSDVEVLEIEIQALRDLFDIDPQLGLKIQEYMIKILMDRILYLRNKALHSSIE